MIVNYLKPTRFWLAVLSALLLSSSSATAAVLFSYDASTGQFPSDQGWTAFEVDAEGPLTASNTVGTSADNANVAMETHAGDGLGLLHIRDTLSDGTADLPNYVYAWSAGQKQALINYDLKFTMVFKGQTTNTGGKGNVRIDLSGSAFESFDNIDANRAIQVQGLSAELVRPDDDLHTLVIIGENVGPNDFVFSATYDGDALASPIFGNIASPNSTLADSVYFGASSSGNRGTDIFVRSVVMETINVPEPSSLLIGLSGLSFAGSLFSRRNWLR